MFYKYPPIIKYVVFFVLLFLFIKEQNVIKDNEDVFMNTFIIVAIVAGLDYVLIHEHPSLLHQKEKTKKAKKVVKVEEKEEIHEEPQMDGLLYH